MENGDGGFDGGIDGDDGLGGGIDGIVIEVKVDDDGATNDFFEKVFVLRKIERE